MKRPLVVSTLVFCLGIVVADVIRIPFLIAYALTAIFLLFSFLSVKHELSFKISLCSLIFLLGIIFKYVSPLPGSILDAMILGERKGIPALIYNSMVKSGTVHILAGQYTKLSAFAF